MIRLKVLTIGTFDLLHEGHVNLLNRCRTLGGVDPLVYIGVNSDPFVEQYKGRPPVCPAKVRMTTVKAYGSVWLNDGPGERLIRLLRPDLLVVGSDWHESYLWQIEMTHKELFDELGVSLVYVPRTPGISSSELRA